jgi:hypothetical protein
MIVRKRRDLRPEVRSLPPEGEIVRRRLVFPVAVTVHMALVALGQSSASRADVPDLGADERDAYAWFDRLGFPDVTGCRFVRLVRADVAPQYAFETPGGFLTRDLELRVGPVDPARVRVEPADLVALARQRLLILLRPVWPYPRSFGPDRLPDRARDFFLARACARANEAPLAHALFVELVRAGYPWLPEGVDPAELPTPHARFEQFFDGLKQDLLGLARRRAFRPFADIRVARRDLVAPLTSLVACFGSDGEADELRQTIAALESIERSDAESARHPAVPRGQLPLLERTRLLVRELRDQTSLSDDVQETPLGGDPADVFDDPRGSRSAAHELRALGSVALPALVDAFPDTTPTRCVHLGSVLTVGEASRQVAAAIAGRSWVHVAEVTSWLALVRTLGETQALVDAVASGAEESAVAAEQLIRRYPEAALGALKAGLSNASTGGVRRDLVEAARGLEGDVPLGLWRDVLARDPDAYVRVAAGERLFARGDRSALEALEREWEASPNAPVGLERTLALSGDAGAIQVLAHDLERHGADTKAFLLSALARDPRAERCSGPIGPARAALVEALLVGLLDDATVLESRFGLANGDELDAPRIADMAAMALAVRWPERYRFDLHEPLASVRARARIRVANVFRAARELAPLQVPPEPVAPAPAPAATLGPLLDRVLAAPDAEVAPIVSEVLALGVPALPQVEATLAAIAPERSSSLARLGALAVAVSSLVSVADVSSGVAPDGLRRELAALVGKPLDPGFLARAVAALPPDCGGLEVTVERGSDGAGVRVHVALLGGGPIELQVHLVAGDGDDGRDDVPYLETFTGALASGARVPVELVVRSPR